jgi:predicted CopG family antitoxin
METNDLGDFLVARNTHQDLDSIPDLDLGIQYLVGSGMMYDNLIKLKDELGKKALREPRTADELLARKNYRRVMTILWKRYDYDIEDAMEEYRRQDQMEEIAQVIK